MKITFILSILTSHTYLCIIGIRDWGLWDSEMQQPKYGFILRVIKHCVVMLLWFPDSRAVMTSQNNLRRHLKQYLYIYKR